MALALGVADGLPETLALPESLALLDGVGVLVGAVDGLDPDADMVADGVAEVGSTDGICVGTGAGVDVAGTADTGCGRPAAFTASAMMTATITRNPPTTNPRRAQ